MNTNALNNALNNTLNNATEQAQDKTYNILFLCTGNSARSIMAEALVTTLSHHRFKGFSAGSHPSAAVNPFAIEQIKKTGYPTETLRSKSWDEFAQKDAPHMDFIITVCDNAAGETCPLWLGHPVSAHWGFEDPASAQGTDAEKRRVFETIYAQIVGRINAFLSLPSLAMQPMDKLAIQQAMKSIGESQLSEIKLSEIKLSEHVV